MQIDPGGRGGKIHCVASGLSPLTAGDRVAADHARQQEPVIARATLNQIAAAAAVQRVIADATAQRVGSSTAGQPVIARPGAEPLGCRRARRINRVILCGQHEHLDLRECNGAAGHDDGPGLGSRQGQRDAAGQQPKVEHVAARLSHLTPHHGIAAATGQHEQIVLIAALDQVTAAPAVQRVIAATAHQSIAPGATGQAVIAQTARHVDRRRCGSGVELIVKCGQAEPLNGGETGGIAARGDIARLIRRQGDGDALGQARHVQQIAARLQPLTTADGVATKSGGELKVIIPGTARIQIIAQPANQRVIAIATIQTVGPVAAAHQVRPGAAEQLVIARQPVDGVRTAKAKDQILADIAGQGICRPGSVDLEPDGNADTLALAVGQGVDIHENGAADEKHKGFWHRQRVHPGDDVHRIDRGG